MENATVHQEEREVISPRVKFWVRTFSMLGLVPGFMTISSLMAESMGEGRTLVLSSLLGLIAVPFGVFRYILRHHRRPLLSSVVLLGLFHWALTVAALLASTSSTLLAVKNHGGWPVAMVLEDRRSAVQRRMKEAVSMVPGAPDEVPYDFHSGAMVVEVTFSSRDRKVKAPMILDTGATITAVSREVLDALGITVPDRAPVYGFETANGETSYPLVIIDKISIGTKSVSPIVVAVCDECATDSSYGLLGLNFSSHFRIRINEREGHIILQDKDQWVDRRDEMEPFLDLIPSLNGHTLEADLVNRAPLAMKGVIVTVTFLDTRGQALDEARITVADLPPNTPHRFDLPVPKGTDGLRWELSRAFWNTDNSNKNNQ